MTAVIFRGDDPPYPPLFPTARPMAEAAIVSGTQPGTTSREEL
jgi:hypothetical protein